MGPYDKNECFEKCSNFTPIEEDTVQADEQNGIFPCAGYDSEDCRYVFIYKELNETHYEVKTQKERECPAKVLRSFFKTEQLIKLNLLGVPFRHSVRSNSGCSTDGSGYSTAVEIANHHSRQKGVCQI